MAWPALLAVACMAIVALVREPEPQPVAEAASFSEPVKAPAVAPARKPAAPRKTRALLPAPAPATDPMEAATPEQWRAESYANRITFTANYVSARANVGSTVNLRNAAIWMETCISTSAAQAASVGPAASACFADLARRR